VLTIFIKESLRRYAAILRVVSFPPRVFSPREFAALPALSLVEAQVLPLPEEARAVADVRLPEAVYSAVQQARSGSALVDSAAPLVDGSPAARQVDDSPVESVGCLAALPAAGSVAADCWALQWWGAGWVAPAPA